MSHITFNSSSDRFIISIDKKAIDKDTLLRVIEQLRLEFLAQKVNFDLSIEELGEEITKNWWAGNKDRFIPKEEQ